MREEEFYVLNYFTNRIIKKTVEKNKLKFREDDLFLVKNTLEIASKKKEVVIKERKRHLKRMYEIP